MPNLENSDIPPREFQKSFARQRVSDLARANLEFGDADAFEAHAQARRVSGRQFILLAIFGPLALAVLLAKILGWL